jgi:hypothetical protein
MIKAADGGEEIPHLIEPPRFTEPKRKGGGNECRPLVAQSQV